STGALPPPTPASNSSGSTRRSCREDPLGWAAAMTEPITVSAATLAAVARLVLELGRFGFGAWRGNRAARDRLIAILTHVQIEIESNRRSVRAALNGSRDEWLSMDVYDVAIEALAPALANDDTASILNRLQSARGLMTFGLQ